MPSSSSSEGSCWSDAGSEMADFLCDVAGDSADGGLPPPQKSDAADDGGHGGAAAVAAAAPPVDVAAAEELRRFFEEADPAHAQGEAAPDQGLIGAALRWSAVQASFRRSDSPRQVAELFLQIHGWQTEEVQQALWERVLSERAAGGAGSREYTLGVLKAVISRCDAARAEVAERLVSELLRLQPGAQAAADPTAGPSLALEPEPEPEPARPYVVPRPTPGSPLQPRHVVSLGCDCFSRTMASRLGFMRRRLEGYESGPFDIAYHSYAAVCSLLRDDFAGYMGAPVRHIVAG